MFGYIKVIFTVMIISAIAGAGMYVMKLRSDNAVLKANQIELERSIESQQELLQQQKEDFIERVRENIWLNTVDIVDGLKSL